jgi:ABC-type transport system involved in cytochrome c biogenesis permease subunit
VTGLELVLVWVAIASYSFSFLFFLTGLVFRKERLPRWGFMLSVLGFVLHTGTIITRWVATGHLPVMMTYEFSLLGTWFVVLTYFIMRYAFPLSRPFGDVLFAWFAFGAYVTAFAAGVMYLLKGWGKKGILSRLPELKLLDELSFRLILFGFFAEAIMIASGAIWAHSLWGRYWGWDPVETWSLVSWLAYGLNLHLRVSLGWRGKKAAWLAIGSLFGVIFLYFGMGFVSKLHTSVF